MHKTVIVPTSVEGRTFQVNESQLNQLRNDGWSMSFYIADNGKGRKYVRDYRKGNRKPELVARALVPTSNGRIVYLNGDSLDLRQQNLVVSGGW